MNGKFPPGLTTHHLQPCDCELPFVVTGPLTQDVLYLLPSEMQQTKNHRQLQPNANTPVTEKPENIQDKK